MSSSDWLKDGRPGRSIISAPPSRMLKPCSAVNEERAVGTLNWQLLDRLNVSSQKRGNIARNREGFHR